MAENFVDIPVSSLLEHLCANTVDRLFLVNPSRRIIRELAIRGGDQIAPGQRIDLLAEEWTLKDELAKFTVACKIADLVEDGSLTLRYATDPPKTAMVIDSDRVVAIIEAGDRAGLLQTTDRAFVEDLVDGCTEWYDSATSFPLRTPPLSRIKSTLDERFGKDRCQDFISFTEHLGDVDHRVDEVAVSLLVASKHRDLLYDVSKWGEDIGLASKATFSRKKADLEQIGLIDTEKEQIDVGRPRLRLKLATKALREASPAELIDRAAESPS